MGPLMGPGQAGMSVSLETLHNNNNNNSHPGQINGFLPSPPPVLGTPATCCLEVPLASGTPDPQPPVEFEPMAPPPPPCTPSLCLSPSLVSLTGSFKVVAGVSSPTVTPLGQGLYQQLMSSAASSRKPS